MKLTLLLIPLLLFMTSCSIDWNGEKDKKIAELEKQVDEMSRKINTVDTNKETLSEKKLNFENDLICQERANGMKKTSTNIISGYYNAENNKCYLKVFNKETNSIEDGPIDNFGPINLIPKEEPPLIFHDKENQEGYSWVIMQDVNLREYATIQSKVIRPIIKGELVIIKSNTTIGNQKWYQITTSQKEEGWISELGFQKNDNAKSASDPQ